MARRWLAVALVALSQAGAGSEALGSPAVATSAYLPMRDGVRLAVDIRLVGGIGRGPTALLTTRYGRATEQHPTWVAALSQAGIHFVIVDARGTGASSGSRPSEFSPAEVSDIGELIDWIVAQPWSDGSVASLGNSYAGDTAELALASGRPALRAALVRHNEFDVYRDLAFPGGVRNAAILRIWGDEVFSDDLGTECLGGSVLCAQAEHLEPVGSNGATALRAAILEHQANSHPDRDTRAIQFVDDMLPTGIAFETLSAKSYLSTLRKSSTALQYWGSWMDAGTANSALARFAAVPEAPMEVFIAPWTHGGAAWADPLGSAPALEGPVDRPRQLQKQIEFLARSLRGDVRRERMIHYFPLGGDHWRETRVWPPVGVQTQTWYLQSEHRLDEQMPESGGGERDDPAHMAAAQLQTPAPRHSVDVYAVDFTATTGKQNRWFTQLGGRPVEYGDRRESDGKLLTYTSKALPENLELAGYPRVVLNIASSATDGAVFAYLEDVAPNGAVRYVTEGQLRMIHRRLDDGAPSFDRADAQPVTPGISFRLVVTLMPVAAIVQAGHRLRLAIGGHDADTFARYPESGALSFEIQRGGADAARLELPVLGSGSNRSSS